MVQQLEEEDRKIQFSGKSSYMLALPKKWVEEMGLRPGDKVVVAKQSNTSLTVSMKGDASSGSDRNEVTIELSQKDKASSIVRKLISLYLIGYNLIHVRSKEGVLISTQRDVMKEGVRRHFIGTEVVADSVEGTTLQVLLSYPQLNVENALRRMFLIAASMHKDAMFALKKLDIDSAKGVLKTDDEVDRFSLYVIRQLKMAVQNDRILKEIGLTRPRDCLGYRLIIKSVERVADHACRIAQRVLSIAKPLDVSILSKITELSDFALTLFEESGVAFFKQNYAAADEIVDKAKYFIEMEKNLLDIIEKGKFMDSYYTIRFIVEDIRRTAEYASDIAEITLNMTVAQIVVK